MQKTLSLLAVVLCLILCFSFEEPLSQRIANSLINHVRTFPQEKVYIHTDKPYYHTGDTIWVKAYVIDAVNHFPDSASQVLYIDLIDTKEGKLTMQKILRIANGYSHGQFELMESLTDGNYRIRAYTNWMRNFPESLFFEKDIKIYKGSILPDEALPDKELADLSFYPEGGDMVSDLNSRVAFKALNLHGQAIDVQGFILSSKRDTAATFKSVVSGMGFFNFTPAAGQSYTAFAKDASGLLKSFPLPKISDHGFTLGLDNLSSKEEIKIYISHNYSDKKNLTIIAHQKGKVAYAADIKDAKGSFSLRVPLTNFKEEGVAHFTLFSDDNKPVCERLVYISSGKSITGTLITDKKTYAQNGKVVLTIRVKDSNGKPVKGNFSVAVTDESQIAFDPDSENITSYFLLSSDIASRNDLPDVRGNIENPGLYFDKSNPLTGTYRDILLMTQGWRRFTWSDVSRVNSYDTTYSIEPGFQLSGTVKQSNNVIPESFTPTFMISPKDKESIYVQGNIDSNGRFIFKGLDFSDSTTITAADQAKGKKLNFTFDPVTIPFIQPDKNYNPFISQDKQVLYNFLLLESDLAVIRSKNNRLLKEVVVTAKREEPFDSRRTMLPSSKSGSVLKVTPSVCSGTMSPFQMLQSRVAGVKIFMSNGEYKASLRSTGLRGPEPIYLLDGIVVDASAINTLNSCSLETVEVYRTPSPLFGARGSNGVIAFFTNYSVDTKKSAQLIKIMRMGYSAPREFFSPKYSTRSVTVDDLRSTIYWNPVVITDSNGIAKVEFWNSSLKGDIRAVLEGLSYQGMPVSSTITYSVQ